MEVAIDIYGREGCDVCKRFTKRVEEMGFRYNKHDVDYHITHHDGWRDDSSVEVLAAMHTVNDGHLPVTRINGKFMTFSHSINHLKELKNVKN